MNNQDKTKFLAIQTPLALAPGHNGSETFDTAAALQKYRIDTSIEIKEPPVIISINGIHIATLGNFSLLIGRAKSRKTFLATSLTAAAAGHCSIEDIKGIIRTGADKILYFDTEQSPYHAQKTIKRIFKQIGTDQPVNLQAYGLRPLDPSERWKVIEYAITNTPGVALVVIDGIVDLLSRGINDEEEAIKLTSALLRWTLGKNIHIITILHQNKGDFNARGHIGTSLVNKAETVLSVTKDPKVQGISIVKVEHSRDIDFKPFAFTISEDGLPQTYQIEGTQSRKTATIAEYFARVLPGMRAMGYTELCQEYLEISGSAERTAKRHISQAVQSGILEKDNNGMYRMTSINSNESDTF